MARRTTVQGLDRLKRKLTRFPKEVEAEIRKAMEQGADEVVALAKSLVNVDSGALRDSIGWTWGDPPKGAIVIASARAPRAGNLRLSVFAGNDKAFHARWLEFGTAPHAQGGEFAGTEHPGTRAQPFFFPAYRAVRRRIRGRVTRAVNKAAKKIAASQ